MAGLNFQDEKGGDVPNEGRPAQPPQTTPTHPRPSVEDIFGNEYSIGTRLLWILLVVVVLGAIGGGLYYLQKHGYLKLPAHKAPVPAAVTQPAPTNMAESPAPSSAKQRVGAPGSFTLQVAAFRQRSLADKFVSELRAKGINSRVVSAELGGEGTWYKVCTGSFGNRIRAIAAVEGMKKRVGTDVWVVPSE